MAYLAAAYGVLWAISFGLVFSIVLRQRRLQSELRALQIIVEEDPKLERDW